MDYKKIKNKIPDEKQSRKNDTTEAICFGDFSVMQSSCGKWFIVDSDISDSIKHRRWQLDSGGYLKTDIVIEGEKVSIRLHDYVMSTIHDRKPENCHIDHINGCKTDNRRCNLRIVTPSFNLRNVRRRSNNTSGVNGVARSKSGKWRAYITVNQKQISLGTYSSIDEAITARYCAEEKLGFCHTADMEKYISSQVKNGISFAVEMEVDAREHEQKPQA